MAPHEASVCASSLERGNVAALHRASRRYCYRNSESSSFSCDSFRPLAARTGVIPLITFDASARHSRRVSAVAAGQTYLPLCARLRGDLYPSAVEAQLSLMQTERRWAGHFLPLRGQRLLTRLCSAGDMSAHKLPAGTFGGRKVWISEGKLCFRCH